MNNLYLHSAYCPNISREEWWVPERLMILGYEGPKDIPEGVGIITYQTDSLEFPKPIFEFIDNRFVDIEKLKERGIYVCNPQQLVCIAGITEGTYHYQLLRAEHMDDDIIEWYYFREENFCDVFRGNSSIRKATPKEIMDHYNYE